MAKDTLKLTLEGDIPIDQYAEAIGQFNALVQALSEEVAGSTPIEWSLSELSTGSATAVLRGTAADDIAVQRVVIAYSIVGRALERGQPIPYSEEVVAPAVALTGVLNGHIKAVRLITDDHEASVLQPVKPETQRRVRRTALGVLTGVVNTISAEPRPRLTLHDDLFDRAVNCYPAANQRDLMRDVWNKRVAVMGMIYRDPETGRPVQVTDIISITATDEKQPGAFLRAGGALPWQEGDEPSEVMIRRIRDAD